MKYRNVIMTTMNIREETFWMKFDSLVQEKISEGWVTTGGVCMHQNPCGGEVVVTQSLVKESHIHR